MATKTPKKNKDTKKPKGKNGGKRPGAGRPIGTKDPETLEREKVAERLRQRTYQIADRLFDKQLHLANGQQFLYKIEKYWKGSGKNRTLMKKKPKRVTSEWEIQQYLEGLLEEGDLHDPEDTYYFITTKESNAAVIDSMLNRALGSANRAPSDDDDPDSQIKQIIIVKNYGKQSDRPTA